MKDFNLCSICGKKIKDNSKAYALVLGEIYGDNIDFVKCSHIYHKECLESLTSVVKSLNVNISEAKEEWDMCNNCCCDSDCEESCCSDGCDEELKEDNEEEYDKWFDEEFLSTLSLEDFYFDYGYDEDFGQHYFTIAPKEYYDEKKCIPSSEGIDEFLEELLPDGWYELQESTYEYDGDVNDGIKELKELGLTYKKM